MLLQKPSSLDQIVQANVEAPFKRWNSNQKFEPKNQNSGQKSRSPKVGILAVLKTQYPHKCNNSKHSRSLLDGSTSIYALNLISGSAVGEFALTGAPQFPHK